jgi:acyl-CoA reductase-like NAD-dependent aldehyde dehydrogenase
MVASIKPHRDEIGLSDGLLLIDGSWAAARSGESWRHSHPATGEEVASFPIAGPQDVDAAVRAARQAFDEGPWPRARAAERIRVLRRIAGLVREHGDELLALQALDNSVPLSFGSVYGMSANMDRAAGRQGGGRLLGEQQQRCVPRDDRTHHADRLAQRHHQVIAALVGRLASPRPACPPSRRGGRRCRPPFTDEMM